MSRVRGVLGAGGLVLLGAWAALAAEPVPPPRRVTAITSVEAGGGRQDDLALHSTPTDLEFWNAAVRVGLLPAESVDASGLGRALTYQM